MKNATYTDENGHIHIRRVVMIDGKPTYHRRVISKGESLKGCDAETKALAKKVWTKC